MPAGTIKDVFINPAATGANDGTSPTDAYVSIATWVTNEAIKDLVANDTQINVWLIAGAIDPDVFAIIDGTWTCDATRYIHIRPYSGSEHGGIPGAGYKVASEQFYGYVGIVTEPYCVLQGFEVVNTGTYASGTEVSLRADQGIYISMLAKSYKTAFDFANGGGSALLRVFNCIAYDSETGFTSTGYVNPVVYNSMAVNCATGFGDTDPSNGEIDLRNNIELNITTDWDLNGDWNASSGHNATDAVDTTGVPGSNNQANLLTSDFTDHAGKDWSIANPSSVLVGNGEDLATALSGWWFNPGTNDIAGNSRSGSWDIGPFAYVVGGSAPAGTTTISGVTPSYNSATITYSYSDTDQDSFEYRIDGGVPATIGASPATITGLAADTNYDVEIRAVNAYGDGAWSSVSNFTTTAEPPANTVSPVASGSGYVGDALTVSNGTWSGSSPITYTYQWQLDGVDITGETTATYTPVSGDIGGVVRCVVTGTNSAGSSSANSNGITIVAAPSGSVVPPFYFGFNGGFQ